MSHADGSITQIAFRAPAELYADFRVAVCRRRRTIQYVLTEAMRQVVEEDAREQAMDRSRQEAKP